MSDLNFKTTESHIMNAPLLYAGLSYSKCGYSGYFINYLQILVFPMAELQSNDRIQHLPTKEVCSLPGKLDVFAAILEIHFKRLTVHVRMN